MPIKAASVVRWGAEAGLLAVGFFADQALWDRAEQAAVNATAATACLESHPVVDPGLDSDRAALGAELEACLENEVWGQEIDDGLFSPQTPRSDVIAYRDLQRNEADESYDEHVLVVSAGLGFAALAIGGELDAGWRRKADSSPMKPKSL